MPLIDRKIPIITGVNDVPSVTGGATHPNASLLCNKYNALIDDLDGSINNPIPLATTTFVAYPLEIYVSAITGNDTTGDGTALLPFATIQRAIDKASEDRILDQYIAIEGIFTNPSLDFRNCYGVKSQASGYYSPEDYFDNGIRIQKNNYSTEVTKIVFNNNFDDANYDTADTIYSYILGKTCNYHFHYLDIEFIGNDNNVFRDCNVWFYNCNLTFNLPATAYIQFGMSFIDAHVFLEYCTFTWDSNVSNNLFSALRSIVWLQSCTFVYLDGTVPSATIPSIAKAILSTIWLNTDLGIPATYKLNDIKYCTVYVDTLTYAKADFQLNEFSNTILGR